MVVEATLPEDIQGIIALAQNELVQEWHGYLDAVFVEVLKQCLGSRRFHGRLPKMNVGLSDLSWDRKPNMIESACKSLQEQFSFYNYSDKIPILTRLFGITPNGRTAFEVAKHVMIRNVLQHSHGLIRSADLRRIGREGQKISVLDQDGNVRQFGENDKIELSVHEIEKLATELRSYSSHFGKLQ